MKEAILYLHDQCNYQCSYCLLTQSWHPKKESRAATGHGQDKILRFFTDNSNWVILLTGGEPTVLPNFVEFAGRLAKDNIIRLES